MKGAPGRDQLGQDQLGSAPAHSEGVAKYTQLLRAFGGVLQPLAGSGADGYLLCDDGQPS